MYDYFDLYFGYYCYYIFKDVNELFSPHHSLRWTTTLNGPPEAPGGGAPDSWYQSRTLELESKKGLSFMLTLTAADGCVMAFK